MILAGCSIMYSLQTVLHTLHSYSNFFHVLLHGLKISINDPIDGFQFFIPYSIIGIFTISVLIRLFLLPNKMQSTSTTSCLLEWTSVKYFQLGWDNLYIVDLSHTETEDGYSIYGNWGWKFLFSIVINRSWGRTFQLCITPVDCNWNAWPWIL